MKIAGTGHRPDKLGGYGPSTKIHLVRFAGRCLREIQPEILISGMAQGWDQALACAAIRCNIPFWAAIPCDGQELAWPEESQQEYHKLLEQAEKKIVVCPGPYAVWKMQKRNEWMVDAVQDGAVLALWDGSPGGTANCVRYARKIGVTVVNVWSVYWSVYSKFISP